MSKKEDPWFFPTLKSIINLFFTQKSRNHPTNIVKPNHSLKKMQKNNSNPGINWKPKSSQDHIYCFLGFFKIKNNNLIINSFIWIFWHQNCAICHLQFDSKLQIQLCKINNLENPIKNYQNFNYLKLFWNIKGWTSK